jgi:predicted RNA-binding Zn-ribbon protein involved in translation (DUF1610 family)
LPKTCEWSTYTKQKQRGEREKKIKRRKEKVEIYLLPLVFDCPNIGNVFITLRHHKRRRIGQQALQLVYFVHIAKPRSSTMLLRSTRI